MLEVAEGEPELEARPAPGQPADLGAVALGDERFAAVGGGQGDHRVGVEVVDVVVGRRRRATACRSTAPRRRRRTGILVVADDVVLVRARVVHSLEGAHPVEHEEGDPGDGERAEVATGALHREHRVGAPVIGSASVSLADVFPPAKFVTRLSAPRRWERASRATIVGSAPARHLVGHVR